ncbi:Transcriptional regulatory protein sin3 [Dinochytrium kinnereticum]|nr:Transcriptional regulatory protein sin3 [Dinochytrium kinnereticum]
MQSNPPPHAGHHASMGQHIQHAQNSLPPPPSGPGAPSQPPSHHPIGQAPTTQNLVQSAPTSNPTVTITSAAPSGPAYDQARPLNVKDALTYLDQVKIQFQDFPHVYNQFLDIMKDFKAQTIDTPGVIERVSTLFRGYPNLINGFNTFLPPGYRLEAPANPKDPVRVTTPQTALTGIHGEAGGANASYTGASSVGGGPSHPVYYPPTGSQPVYAPVQTPASSGSAPPTHSPPYPHGPPPPTAAHHSIPHSQSQPIAASGAQAAAAVAAAAAAQPSQTGSGQQGPPPPPNYVPPPPPASAAVSSGSTPPAQPAAVASAAGATVPSASTPSRKAPVEFNHAINYVNKIKNRFAAEPETYKQFLEILQTYQKEQRPIQEVYSQVQVLFKNAPDLLDEFKQFLPDTSAPGGGGAPGGRGASTGVRMPPIGNFMQSTGDRRSSSGMVGPGVSSQGKKGTKRSATGTIGGPQAGASSGAVGIAPSKKRSKGAMQGSDRISQASGAASAAAAQSSLPRPDTIEELEWIDRCKRTIGNKATYNEFLKVLNLFSQEIIDAKTLVERVEPFLSRAPELFDWFKKFVKYEEDVVIFNTPAERPEVDLRTCRKVGHSYRLLPPSNQIDCNQVPRSVCSGRDDIAREVLNDDWISQPEYVSETGFIAHKKTQYEEALHKCEEERYEFDINIEANLHTIALLEPVYRKIQTMSPEEKSKFKLPLGLGGQSTIIYQRVIKKIYDKDKGQEVIDALHHNPAVAVPVVLKRLKQKDEEWKRAQRDWNKIWREIDAKNYYKALDHQGITFKANDKKNMSTKTLIAEIENIYREQKERKALLTHGAAKDNVPLTRYQLELRFKDPEIFRDVRRLIMGQVTNTQSISQSDEDRIGEFLASFVRRFFFSEGVDDLRDDDGDGDVEDGNESNVENDDAMSTGNGEETASVNGNGTSDIGNGTGLRRDLLMRRAEAGGLVGSKRGSGDQTDDNEESTSLAASGDELPSVTVKKENAKGGRFAGYENGQKGPRRRRMTYSCYANATLYCFFRLYQVLYSRLLKMKEMSQFLADNPPRAETLNPTAVDLGIQSKEPAPDAIIPNVKDRYSGLLRAIHDLFDGKLETQEFEDRCRALFGTSGYLMFTVDKLIQSVVKQIQAIQTDQKVHDLVSLYVKDRDKPSTSSRQEAIYRLSAEGLIQDENVYRLEYYVRDSALTIQLLNKEDSIVDDSISSEEKWSLYVDHFIQLSTTEGVRLKHRSGPFLRRNLPAKVPEEPPTDVETRSGLELKICLNTYKIFFVENTEDYFRRKRPPVKPAVLEARKAAAESNVARFRAWIEERGRELEAEEEEAAALEASAMAVDESVVKPSGSEKKDAAEIPPKEEVVEAASEVKEGAGDAMVVEKGAETEVATGDVNATVEAGKENGVEEEVVAREGNSLATPADKEDPKEADPMAVDG